MDARTTPGIAEIESRLDSLRNTIRRTAFIQGAALVVRLVCLCLAIAFLIDIFWDAPRLVRLGLLLATSAAAFVVIVLRIIRPLVRRIGHEELAALVESAHPEMEERLLSSLELARSTDRDALKGSPLMREQLMKETARATRDLPFDEVVDSSRAVRQTVMACIAFLAVLAPFVVLQEGYGNLWARFFNPWGNHAHGMTLTLEVQPGDTTVPVGEDVAIAVVPHFRFAKSGTITRGRILWTDDDGETEFRDLKPLADQPGYTAMIPQVARGLHYRVESDQGSSREYRVEVVERPALTGLTVDVQPPAYCGRAAQRIDGLVGETAIFERSKLTFRATFNKPVAEVRWLWLEDVRHKYDQHPLTATGKDRLKSASISGLAFARDDAQLMRVDADGKSATWELTADREGAFEIVLLDKSGIQNRHEPGRSFRLIRDAAPTVAWADQESQPTARPDDVVAFEVAATDDIGLGALELHYSVLPHRTQAGVMPSEPALLGGQEFTNRFPIDLRKLSLPEGALVAVKARAADERPVPGPNEAWTTERVISISRDAAAFGSNELKQRHQRIRDELAALRQEASAREDEAAALRQKARDAQNTVNEAAFRTEADQLALRSEQLKERLEQTAADLKQEGLAATLSPRLQEVAEQNAAPAAKDAERARDAIQADRSPALQNVERKMADAVQKLADAEKRFEELAKLENDLLELNRIADKTERLAGDVASFEQHRREQARAQQNQPEAASQQAAPQKELETQRKQLQQEQKELSKNLQDVLNRRPEVLEAARADLMEKLKDLGQRAEQLAGKEERLSQAMQQAGNQNAQSLRQVAESQKTAQSEAEKLAAQVANQERQRLVPTPDLSRIEEALKNLEKGNPQAAAEAQRQAAEDLEQLARALEKNEQLPADPQEAARELARREQALKNELAEAVKAARDQKSEPSPETLKKLAAEQAALQAATAQLEVPPSSEPRQNEALKEGAETLQQLLEKKPDAAIAQADRTRSRLEQLAKDIGTPEEREKRLARDAEQLRKQQAEVAQALEKKRDQDRTAGRKPGEDPRELADLLRKQDEILRQAAALEAAKSPSRAEALPLQAEAVQKAAETQAQLKAGNPEDAAPAARQAEQKLADLAKSLKNEQATDDQLERLLKEQRDITSATEKALHDNDRPGIEQARGRQQKQAEEIKRLDTPAASELAQAARQQAQEAARSLAAAKEDEDRRPAAQEAVQQATQALERLANELSAKSPPPSENARQLAAQQQQRAEAAAQEAAEPLKAQAPPATSPQDPLNDALAELNRLPAPGAAEQKQAAARALAEARQAAEKAAEARRAQPADATEPTPELQSALAENSARQTAAAETLSKLAEQLNQPGSESAAQATRQQAQQASANAAPSRSQELAQASQAARQLATEQSEIREKTQPLAEGLPDRAQQKSQMDAVRSRQQKLAEQIESLPAGVDPISRAQAESSARAAEKSLSTGNPEAAAAQQALAQESLEQMARSAQQQAEQLAAASPPPPAASNPPSQENPAAPAPSNAAAGAAQLAEQARALAESQRQAAATIEQMQKPGGDQLATASSGRPASPAASPNDPPSSATKNEPNPGTANPQSTDPPGQNTAPGQQPAPSAGQPQPAATSPENPSTQSSGTSPSQSPSPPSSQATGQSQPAPTSQSSSGSPQPGESSQKMSPPAASPQSGSSAPPAPAGQQPPRPTSPSNDAAPQPGQTPTSPGQSPQPESGPSSSNRPTPAEAARAAVAQQQQVSQNLAQAALDAATQTAGTPLAAAASRMARAAAEASENASLGASREASTQGQELARQANDLARQLEENPVAQGGPQPELAERLRELAKEQNAASANLGQMSGNREARNAAQSQGQQQLKEQTEQLKKDFEDLADRLKAQPVDRKRQSEQARDARSRSDEATREMQQAQQTAERGDSGSASEAAQAAAEELRKAARMAVEERGFDPGKSPNNPVPNETGSQVAQAARELQKAGEMLAEAGQPQAGNKQAGQQGEQSPKSSASNQAADSKSQKGESQSPGQMEPEDGANEGLAEGLQDGPPQASEMLKQGAHSLRQAASQLKLRPGQQQGQEGQPGGEQGDSQPSSGQTKQGSASGAREQVRIVDVEAHLEKLSTRNWGELPGKLQTEILQSARRRPDGDYAPLIRSYFDRISRSQPADDNRRED